MPQKNIDSKSVQDGPASPLFSPIRLSGNTPLSELGHADISREMASALPYAPCGTCVSWGLKFDVGNVVAILSDEFVERFEPVKGEWLVFMHTSDLQPLQSAPDGLINPMRGEGRLGEHAANYVILFEGGDEISEKLRCRFQIGSYKRRWGENCFEAVTHKKPHPLNVTNGGPITGWGQNQTRVTAADIGPSMKWMNWLWAWKNPYPDKAIIGIRFEPVSIAVIVSAISVGNVASLPLRWRTRRKAMISLSKYKELTSEQGDRGLIQQIQLDMGQIISVLPRQAYPSDSWSSTHTNQLPLISDKEVLIEYSSHENACFHLPNKEIVPVKQVESEQITSVFQPIAQESQLVKLHVKDRESNKCITAKLHVHGDMGENLAPVNRNRIINPFWLEDFGVDYVHLDHESFGEYGRYLLCGEADMYGVDVTQEIGNASTHSCAYIDGEATLRLPLGKVYIEVSKGFEFEPVRTTIEIAPDTKEIVVELDRALPWRDKGWITADTHVHFLSPSSALLEGSAEGVNVVNLLATRLGELVTNVGDFDGKTTWGSRDAGGEGEYLVRVGTENRQHVLGHISLLGYRGSLISPLASGGPDESTLGDPVEILITEWARQCREKGGLVVAPHFPDPRAEIAASIAVGAIDAIEMTSWGDLYSGIDPYSLSDWYRYLNCGYQIPAVGGTDKMSASTPVGAVRTYTHIDPEKEEFSYDAWMAAIQRGETFVTYGPLLEFCIDGLPMGSKIPMRAQGGTVDVSWNVASLTIPMTRVELVVNGEIRESVAVGNKVDSGSWRIRVDESCWMALLLRGQYPGKREIIAAHSSPIMISVEGSPLIVETDAVTILEQIEGCLSYLDTIGTRADDVAYKRMRLVLVSSHRALDNRLHQMGYYHDHIPL